MRNEHPAELSRISPECRCETTQRGIFDWKINRGQHPDRGPLQRCLLALAKTTHVQNQGIDPLSGAKSDCGAQFWNSPGDFIIFHVLQVPSDSIPLRWLLNSLRTWEFPRLWSCSLYRIVSSPCSFISTYIHSPYVDGLNSHID